MEKPGEEEKEKESRKSHHAWRGKEERKRNL